MDVSHKVNQLEDEIKILKKEVQAVLLDIRENLLNRENPFITPQSSAAGNYVNQAAAPEQEKPVDLPPPPPPPDNTEELPLEAVIPEEPVSFEDISGDIEDNGNNENHGPEMVETIEVVQKVTPPAPLETARPETEVLLNTWMPTENSENSNGHNGNGKKPDVGTKENKVKEEKATDELSISIETISGFIDWVEKSVTRLGPEKTKAMLEIAETMKYLKPELKKILVKFVTVNADEDRKEIAFQDYIASLVELAHLLGKDNDSDNVLFYTLYQGLYTTSEGRKNG
jgi:hypothetical protein